MTETAPGRHASGTRSFSGLFFKIFLWFWIAMTLVVFASLLSALATESHPLFAVPWLRFILHFPTEGHVKLESGSYPGRLMTAAGSILKLSGETAVELYENGGEAALTRYIDRFDKDVHIRIFLFNGRQEQLAGQNAPEEIVNLAATTQDNVLGFKRSEADLLISERLHGHKDQYTVVGRLPAGHFLSREREWPMMPLLIILLTAGALCYWLARYITLPIRRLSSATRCLADGDLGVRIGAVSARRNDEIADLGKDFDLMAERIEVLMKTQKRLLRDISHEFRSPLTRLTLALEIARKSEGQESAAALDRIEREAGRLNDLIGQLLTLARLESGTEQSQDEAIELRDLVEEIVADADFEARQHRCAVRIVSSEDCTVFGIRELLRSAIENIVRNAIHFTVEGTEVEVSLRCAMHESGCRAIIQVHDHGPGVPEDALADLFYPFYRVGDSRDRRQGGTGLGLAISDRAVTIHGGKASAANAVDGGLIVTVDLPAQMAPIV